MPRQDLRGMARRAQLASVLLLGCVSLALAAEKVAGLSDDFLEYLGSLESDDENWTDFAAATAAADEPAKPSASAERGSMPVASASSSSVSSRPGPKPRAGNPSDSALPQTGKVEK